MVKDRTYLSKVKYKDGRGEEHKEVSGIDSPHASWNEIKSGREIESDLSLSFISVEIVEE